MIGTVAVINKGFICEELVGWLRDLPTSIALDRPRGFEIAANRNQAVRDMRGHWLLFVDSDMVPPPNTLPLLLSYGRTITVATMLDRRTFDVCATKTFEPTVRYRLNEIPAKGAVPVLAAGTGCMLIQRRVFEVVSEPWFTCGQLVNDCITEDTEFCLRAAERGHRTYLACDVRVGHVLQGIVWPSDDGVARVQWEGMPYSEPMGAFER